MQPIQCADARIRSWVRDASMGRVRGRLAMVGLSALLLAACQREQPADPAAAAEPLPTVDRGAEAQDSGPPKKSPTTGTMTRTPLKDAVPVADTAQAAALVDAQRPRLGMGDDDGLSITGNTADDRGNVFYQISQSYRGIPVFGATGVLEVEAGSAVAVAGSWMPEINIDTSPALEAEQAVRRAARGEGDAGDVAVTFREPAGLVIFAAPNGVHLAWQCSVEVSDWAGAPFAGKVFVDADDGTLLMQTPDLRPE